MVLPPVNIPYLAVSMWAVEESAFSEAGCMCFQVVCQIRCELSNRYQASEGSTADRID